MTILLIAAILLGGLVLAIFIFALFSPPGYGDDALEELTEGATPFTDVDVIAPSTHLDRTMLIAEMIRAIQLQMETVDQAYASSQTQINEAHRDLADGFAYHIGQLEGLALGMTNITEPDDNLEPEVPMEAQR